MQDLTHLFDTSFSGLSRKAWLDNMNAAMDGNGLFVRLDKKHSASYLKCSETLLVSFETIQGIQTLNEQAHPLGWDFVRDQNWSHLALISDTDTWFRADVVIDFMNKMKASQAFTQYKSIMFYGAGPAAYAAAAYSSVAPNSKLLLIQPQATLDPELTGWDERFSEMRRLDFSGDYGFAPDALTHAQQVNVVFDPMERLDAMHATMFRSPKTQFVRAHNMGAALQLNLMQMNLLVPLIAQAQSGTLSKMSAAHILRARRDFMPYLRKLTQRTDMMERPDLKRLICENVTRRLDAPKFQKILDAMNKAN